MVVCRMTLAIQFVGSDVRHMSARRGVYNYFKSLELEIEAGLGPSPPLLSGGTAAYDSTLIQITGGALLAKFRSRVIIFSGIETITT